MLATALVTLALVAMAAMAALAPASAGAVALLAAKPLPSHRSSGGGHRHKPAPPPKPPAKSHVEVVLTTADLSKALAPAGPIPFSSSKPADLPVIAVSEATRYQRVKGVGGAMTDTSAWLMYDVLASGARAFLMRSLFGPTGIRLRFIRIPIGASDFTATGVPYSYDDVPAGDSDPALTNFSVQHDAAYILPALRQALSLDPNAFVMATPWSPPAWMKTNDRLGNPASDPGWLRQTAYAPMAQYLVKFLQEYALAGVHVNAISPQNEPGIHTLYPGMTMNAPDEGRFVHDDLAPALRAAQLGTEIYGYDSNWFSGSTRFARRLIKGPAAPDLTGISSHCYFGEPTVMSTLHVEHPNLDELVSECAVGRKRLGFTTSEFEISSFRNWASAVNLWNIALDSRGGPVQPPNDGCKQCTGLVTISGTHTITYSRDFYQLGQFSKYVDPVPCGSHPTISSPTRTRQLGTSRAADSTTWRSSIPTTAGCCSRTTTRRYRSGSRCRTRVTTSPTSSIRARRGRSSGSRRSAASRSSLSARTEPAPVVRDTRTRASARPGARAAVPGPARSR
jgi:O-glycosyl hydrolase